MAVDPMAFVQASRPQMPSMSTEAGLRPARRDTPGIEAPDGRSMSADALTMHPMNPNYRSRIPPPPCGVCDQDHVPSQEYTHAYTHPDTLTPAPSAVAEGIALRNITDPPVSPPVPATQRVAVYTGRGDDFVLAVEAAPEWDTIQSWKRTPDDVKLLLPVLRVLGVKITDKTGGDLAALQLEAEGH